MYQLGQFSKEHLNCLKKGIELYNEQKYWECHEELEHHWLEYRGDNARLVFWAIIQAAAAMYHFNDNNLIGIHGLIAKAQDKLRRCESLGVETPLLEKSLNWIEFKKLIMSASLNGEIEDYRVIFDFRFKTYF